MRDAFHSMPVAKDSQHLCVIIPYYGSPTYKYVRLGMGLSVSPAIWQQFITEVLNTVPHKNNMKVIMDDVLIFSKHIDHFLHIKELLIQLESYGLKLSPHKCQFFKK
jgi:hypothetical protein